MTSQEKIYILGSGAIGFPLAVFLANTGRKVIAVRTSRPGIAKSSHIIKVSDGTTELSQPIETISLEQLPDLNGIIVVAAKSYANEAIAQTLKRKNASGPIVIMQNGVGVEKPFLAASFTQIYRCIVYATSQSSLEKNFTFRPVTTSPIGIIRGSKKELGRCVDMLYTSQFPFQAEENIQREIWKKAILNSVFNSICPLLDVDNGIFARDENTAVLAREIIQECVSVTNRLDMDLSEAELLAQIMLISQRSDGQLISTLQDIKSGRPTEIESLNLEIARVAATMQPPLLVPKTELLGKMIVAKSLSQTKPQM